MPLLGSAVSDPNFKLRFCVIAFTGILGFGFALVWKSSLIMAAEYQEMPVTQQTLKIKKENDLIKSNAAKKKSIRNNIIKTQIEE